MSDFAKIIKLKRDDGGWGVPPQSGEIISEEGDGSVKLIWEIPEYTEVDGQIVCTAAGVVIRRSTTGYPKDENDGDLVVNSTSIEGNYTDTGLTNETTYYYRMFPYSDHNVFNRDKYRSKISATPSTAHQLHIKFTAAEAVGKTITAKKGADTLTSVVSSSGQASFKFYETGTWNVSGVDFVVSELGVTTNWREKLYGYDWLLPPQEADTEAQISYPIGVDNYGLTPVPACGSDAEISLGDMQEVHEFVGARPVMLNFDGTVAYELDHADQTKKKDGTASDISDGAQNMNAMVEFPKRYIKRWTTTENNVKIGHFRVARLKLDSDYKCKPWLYGNTEVEAVENEEVYMPMFEGSSVSSKVRSIAGKAPMNTNAGATEWTQIQALGAGWIFDDDSDRQYIGDLMLLMSKSTDVQKHWGNGHYSGGSQASHLHTTGSLKDKGPYYGGTGNNNMKFMWLENWYGDRNDRTMGMYLKSNVFYVKDFPPYTADGTVTYYTSLERGLSGTSGGYVSEVTYDEHGMIPKVVSGAENKYLPDGCWFDTGAGPFFLIRGSSCSAGAHVGLVLSVHAAFSFSNWGLGPSLAYKRPAA